MRTGCPVLPVGISGTDRFLGRGSSLSKLGAGIVMRVGRPFVLEAEPGVPRREAMARADARIRAEIAALVEPRHRPADASPTRSRGEAPGTSAERGSDSHQPPPAPG
jgi:1-acyl-sn-glycerol-3-phosphate acyltransferase